jgi:hypothetical protein
MCIVVEPSDTYVTLPGILIALDIEGMGGLVCAVMSTAGPSATVLADILTA